MQKLLLAFVSVVTLMGLLAPSPAFALQERNGDGLARGLAPLDSPTRRGHPQPSHHFNHKHHGQPGKRDVSEFPSRRDGHNHPKPSHHFNHKSPSRRDGHKHPEPSHHFNHKSPSRRDGSHPEPSHHFNHKSPSRRDGHKHPEPSHHFNHKSPSRRDGHKHPEPSHHFNHKSPSRRDGGSHPEPSHHFNHKSPSRRDGGSHPEPSHHFNHKSPSRRDGGSHPEPSHHFNHKSPSRRDGVSHPQPSHHFNHKHHGQPEPRDLSEFPPTGRDFAEHPHPSQHFHHTHHGHKRQERNSDRLARGLPPLPPARRSSARSPQPSHHFNHKHGSADRIEIQDTDGNSLGYLTDFSGNGQDLAVKYHPTTHALSLDDNFGNAHFLGDSDPNTELAPNSNSFVYLTNVDKQQANDDIWSLDGNNKLTATRKNSDGSLVPVYFCLYGAENSAVLTGNPSLPGCKAVYFYLVN